MKKTMMVPFVEGIDDMKGEEIVKALRKSTEGADVDTINWPDEYPYAPQCHVWLARGRGNFAISFEVCGMDLRATQMEDNGRSWEDSCVEFFISKDGKEYVNIETTCIGSILMARGTGRDGRIQLSREDVAKVQRWSTLEKKAYDEEGGAHRWAVTALIPYSILDLDENNLPAEMKGNFYKCGDLTAHRHFASWSPISTPAPNFHCPEFFGTLKLK